MPYSDLPKIDQYALFQLENVVASMKDSYDNYQFYKIYQVCNIFGVVTLIQTYFCLLSFPVAPFSSLCMCVQVFLCTCMHKLWLELCLSSLVYSGHTSNKHKACLVNMVCRLAVC